MEMFKGKESRYGYSQEAHDLDRRVSELLRPVIDEYTKRGASPREIEYVVDAAVQLLCLEQLMLMRKKESQAKETQTKGTKS